MENVEKRKSRNIPLMDYYKILQMEFLSYYFRYLLYEREQDKQKYLDFCKKKKESIEKLALRNCFSSIFSDRDKLEKYLGEFIPSTGLCNFTYRDDHQKKHLGYWDKVYYFKAGTKVVYQNSTWEVINNLCRFDEDYDFVIIEQENKPILKVRFLDIARIFENLSIDL